ncbi:MAG: benzoate transporter [Rhodospirillaceae bacterium]|nr:benzoate transporter [Rhodospirillaceae bacterium]MBT4488973.1 benzoate transporter [Rhodospirillaceae bacterium]MBT5192759.1 benzoate transporter [Rhodospirillaceae bacterium]MBT6427282.1 benzoate transporter [Rhodospirillaceae bacterium]MBT7758104.1 benzoate transporter [Rhodospirillaceae bacterium]
MAILEPPPRPLPGLRESLAGVDRHNLVNALVAWLFAISGPVVIILAVGRQGGLRPEDISSWVFAAFVFGGLLTMAFSFIFRQPIAIMWTIPGAVLVGGALQHLSFPEVLGACLVCGLLIAFLGFTGLVRRIMAAIPMPIVMAMVAGVFLPFGLNIITAFEEATVMAVAMVAAFAIPTAIPRLGRVLPPVLCALAAGTVVIVFSGQMTGVEMPAVELARPIFYTPEFTLRALGELVVPLAVTVIAAQNAQGFVILRQAGFEPPENNLTVACGLGSLLFAMFGSVPTCVTGPANAILNTSGERERRYMAGVIFGLLAIGFGLFSPFTTGLGLVLPAVFINMLGGLAMLAVLQGAFTTAFGGPHALGALVSFLVTLSGVALFNVGSPFWGLVFGYAITLLLQRRGV